MYPTVFFDFRVDSIVKVIVIHNDENNDSVRLKFLRKKHSKALQWLISLSLNLIFNRTIRTTSINETGLIVNGMSETSTNAP